MTPPPINFILCCVFLLFNVCACTSLRPTQVQEATELPIIFSRIQIGTMKVSLYPTTSQYIHFSKEARQVGELPKEDKILIYSKTSPSPSFSFQYSLFPYKGENCSNSLGKLSTIYASLDTLVKENSEVYNHQFEYSSYVNEITEERILNFSCSKLTDTELLDAVDSIHLLYKNTPIDSVGIFLKNILIAANIRDRLNSSQTITKHLNDTIQYRFICALHEDSKYSGSPIQSSFQRYLHTSVRVTTKKDNSLANLNEDSLYTLEEIRQYTTANYYHQANTLATDLIAIQCFDLINNPYFVVLYYFKKVNPPR